MSAGTITLTNGSAIVAGAGTSFSTELTAGDFIVTVVGGVPYTLPVKTVGSNSQVELVSNFTGPTQSGAAWSAVPRVALNMVTAAMVAQNTEALRGLNYDKQNWQQLFSGSGIITVRLPDNSTYTGPSWNSFTTVLEGKAAKGANTDITSLSGLTTALTVAQGGTGGTTASGARDALGVQYGNTAGTVAQGNDARLNTVNGKSGGALTGPLSVPAQGGSPAWSVAAGVGGSGEALGNGWNVAVMNGSTPGNDAYVQVIGGNWLNAGYWQLGGTRNGGQLSSVQITVKGDAATPAVVWKFNNTGIASGNFQSSSDRRIKDNLEVISDPLAKMALFRGYEWDRLDNNLHGYGFIAQDVQAVFPQSVSPFGPTTLKDGSIVEDTLSVDTAGVSAALHHEAILALMEKIDELTLKVEELQSGS